jgi:hypothetical protein
MVPIRYLRWRNTLQADPRLVSSRPALAPLGSPATGPPPVSLGPWLAGVVPIVRAYPPAAEDAPAADAVCGSVPVPDPIVDCGSVEGRCMPVVSEPKAVILSSASPVRVVGPEAELAAWFLATSAFGNPRIVMKAVAVANRVRITALSSNGGPLEQGQMKIILNEQAPNACELDHRRRGPGRTSTGTSRVRTPAALWLGCTASSACGQFRSGGRPQRCAIGDLTMMPLAGGGRCWD